MLKRVASASANLHSWQDEFNHIIHEIWVQGGRKARIGLAVSGGVDSMALAGLCQVAMQSVKTTFVGFVVDHGARSGSDVEALAVASELQRLQIEPHILTLKPESFGGNPQSIAHFETKARTLRYRVIGRACYENDISSLLVGHHSDDQAETVLQRLVGRFHGWGLRGIKAEAGVPECDGIYGVHDSGYPRVATSKPWKLGGALCPAATDSTQMLIEGGGVRISRPLLSFAKSSLMTFCHDNGVKWFQDATNFDPHVATRNSIRHLQGQGMLPRALCTSQLRQFADDITKTSMELEARAQQMFDQVSLNLDLRTGKTQFQVNNDLLGNMPALDSERYRIWALVLRKLIKLTCAAHTDVQVHSLHTGLDLILNPSQPHSHAMGFGARSIADTILRREEMGELGCTYSIERTVPNASSVEASLALPLVDFCQNGHSFGLSQWQLWDGRYWIRVMAPKSRVHENVVSLRFLRKDGLFQLRQSLKNDKESSRQLREALSVAPRDMRFTLPAIHVSSVEGSGREIHDSIIALPSIGWSANGSSRASLHDKVLHAKTTPFLSSNWHWDISYKGIDLSATINERHQIHDHWTNSGEATSDVVGSERVGGSRAVS